ncbi:hypothetical protein PS634_04285 [Pseudomonas fluorescens]|nr:hypothetical protein PS634_04285 [Pseudomonas fluorescens]
MRIHFVEVIEPASVPETTVERDARGAEPTQPASTLIVPIAPRGHASRDAPRHKWHRLRIQ